MYHGVGDARRNWRHFRLHRIHVYSRTRPQSWSLRLVRGGMIGVEVLTLGPIRSAVTSVML